MNAPFTGTLTACRHCGQNTLSPFCNLGSHPPSNYFLKPEERAGAELYLPLNALICTNCWLSQLDYFEDAGSLFNEDYAYYSSFSQSWLEHAKNYTDMMIKRFGYGPESLVVEIASNDGYLLKNIKAAGIKALGVEPSGNVAQAAWDNHGVASEVTFFGTQSARDIAAKHGRANLILGNNVLAHVPDITDFTGGLPELLAQDGVVTFEFPHLQNLLTKNQFDTIYHEHFSYLSLTAVKAILNGHGLRVFDVEQLPTHGGSLRVFACFDDGPHAQTDAVEQTLQQEIAAGLTDAATYATFQTRVIEIKRNLLRFLLDAQESGKRVVGYGAAAKGNTLLNYAGIGADLIEMVADKSPQKQGRLLPGAHIPVVDPDILLASKPDYVVILPWNLRDEIAQQLSGIRDHGGQFVVAIPELAIF
ncbi:MAG: class I SAM-dependent methyltransferase [Paracoccaceae bacterium]